MPSLKYHGLFMKDHKNGELRFGIVKLIGLRQSFSWHDFPGLNKKQRNSILRFDNRAYWQCATKCRDTAFKLNQALNKLSKSLIIIENYEKYCYDGASIETTAIYSQAMDDAPYHLDAFISYLRVLADCISFALPFFYETKQSIPNRGFREQMKWFMKTKPDFDPEYRVILQEQTMWFELLAGKAGEGNTEKGIRDLIFHNFATYQIVSTLLANGKSKVRISQVTSKGITRPNVLSSLEDLVEDFFLYSDRIYDLFTGRFCFEIPEYDWKAQEHSVLMRLAMSDIESKYRLYPIISQNEEHESNESPEKRALSDH